MAEKQIRLKEKKFQNVVQSPLTGATTLHFAVEEGDCEKVASLMKELAKSWTSDGLFVGDNEGATPLHYGATRGQWEAMKVLLDELRTYEEKGGEVVNEGKDKVTTFIKKKDREGRTALHWAAANGKVNTIDMLIKYGANLHCPDNQGRTALHSAALAGNNKVVLALLNWGASINATTARGDTALMLAKRVKREACVKLLKTMGAEDYEECTNGNTKSRNEQSLMVSTSNEVLQNKSQQYDKLLENLSNNPCNNAGSHDKDNKWSPPTTRIDLLRRCRPRSAFPNITNQAAIGSTNTSLPSRIQSDVSDNLKNPSPSNSCLPNMTFKSLQQIQMQQQPQHQRLQSARSSRFSHNNKRFLEKYNLQSRLDLFSPREED